MLVDMAAALAVGLAALAGLLSLVGLGLLVWRLSPRGRFHAEGELLRLAGDGLAYAGSVRLWLPQTAKLRAASRDYAMARQRLRRLGVFLPKVDWRSKSSCSSALNWLTAVESHAADADLHAAREATARLAG